MSDSREPTSHEKNTKEQYEALGRFVEAFEAMVHEVRTICVQILTRRPQDYTLLNIAFSNHVLTAYPLFEIMRAIIGAIVSDEENGIDDKTSAVFLGVLRQIAQTYEDLVSMRNNLLHGTWFIGYSGPGDDGSASEFFIHKYKATKTGLSSEELPKNADQLFELSRICIQTRNWISILHACLAFNKTGLNVAANFRHNGTEWVRITRNGEETLPKKVSTTSL